MNTFNSQKELMELLQKPFKVEEIKFRITNMTADKSKGLAVAYIANSAIQQRLDEIFGPFGWQVEFTDWKNGKAQICTLSVFDGKNWIKKQDGAEDTDFEPTKGGLSDSMKRCARMLGIGRYLSSDNCLINPWVTLDNKRIPKNELLRLRNEYNQMLLQDKSAASKPKYSQQNPDPNVNNQNSNPKNTSSDNKESEMNRSNSNFHSKNSNQNQLKLPTAMVQVIENLIKLNPKADYNGILNHYNVNSIKDLTIEQGNDALKRLAAQN